MITIEEFKNKGVKEEDEKTPLDILNGVSLNTREISNKLSELLPSGSKKISYSCAKQKMARLLARGLVERRRIDGIFFWSKK